MTARPEHVLDFDELLAMEEASPVRHEYIDGKLYLMAGGTPDHSDLMTNITTAVQGRLRGNPCRGSSSEQRVRTSETATNWVYPNFLIKCPPYRFHPRDKNALLNPRAIFEILSPSTAEFDRTGKFDEYALIPELSDYILVSSDKVRVEHYHRAGEGEWTRRVYRDLTLELRLESFEINVPLSEIYEDIEIGEQGVLPGMEDELVVE